MSPHYCTPMIMVAALAVSANAPANAFVGGFVPTSSFAMTRFTKGSALATSPGRRAARGYGSTSTSLQMNLADRFFRVAKANLNNLLQTWEDPEKILEQAVEDMQKDLVKIRQSYAEVSASQKRMERQKAEADRLANSWYERAQLALKNGDEGLAREALTRRQQQTDTAASIGQQMDVQGEALARLRDSTQQLEGKITEAKSQKDTLITRARTAKTTTQVNDMLSSVTGSTSMDAFDRMQEKVENLEANAEIAGELTGSSSVSLEGQFKLLEGSSAVDQELAKMKGLLPGASAGTLPQLTSSEEKSSSQSSPEVQSELDQLRKDLGK